MLTLPLLANSALACEAPEEISIPDGNEATEQEMVDAGKRYHQFMIDNQLYQVCLENQVEQERAGSREQSGDQIRQRENAYAGRHNAASAAMKRVTTAFEKAAEAYKAQK